LNRRDEDCQFVEALRGLYSPPARRFLENKSSVFAHIHVIESFDHLHDLRVSFRQFPVVSPDKPVRDDGNATMLFSQRGTRQTARRLVQRTI